MCILVLVTLSIFGAGFVQLLACMAPAAYLVLRLGWRRTLALSTGVDQLLAWPVAIAMWPGRYPTSCGWPAWLVLVPAWAVLVWLIAGLRVPDEWLPARGIYARKLFAAMALAALYIANPLVAPFFTMEERGLRHYMYGDTVVVALAAAALHYPLWQVLVYGWHRQKCRRLRQRAVGIIAPTPPAGTARRR